MIDKKIAVINVSIIVLIEEIFNFWNIVDLRWLKKLQIYTMISELAEVRRINRRPKMKKTLGKARVTFRR